MQRRIYQQLKHQALRISNNVNDPPAALHNLTGTLLGYSSECLCVSKHLPNFNIVGNSCGWNMALRAFERVVTMLAQVLEIFIHGFRVQEREPSIHRLLIVVVWEGAQE